MKILFFLLLITSYCYANNTADVERICNPANYTNSTDYWNALLQYKLVNSEDIHAKNAVFKDGQFASRVKYKIDEINLFGSASNELVVKMSFNYSSYYIHFFHLNNENWQKTENSLDFYIPNLQQKTNRILDLTYQEIYKKGEYVLLVEKTTAYTDGDNYQSWISLWQVLPNELVMLHNQKFKENSYSKKIYTQIQVETGTYFPKKIKIETKVTVYKEAENEEEEAAYREITTTEEECQFSTKKCDCKVIKSNTIVDK